LPDDEPEWPGPDHDELREASTEALLEPLRLRLQAVKDGIAATRRGRLSLRVVRLFTRRKP
jgi:hypothetical protein